MEPRFVKRMLFCVIILGAFFVPYASACGCGLALSEAKVFNALKETQAYLVIDIQNETSYNEMPFFRMVSMEEPYNVTIVFPIDGIPDGVEGKLMPASQFIGDYQLDTAEDYFIQQNFQEAARKLKGDLKEGASSVFSLSNGFAGIFFRVNKLGAGTNGIADTWVKTEGGVAPIAHFEFEGGTMDIYDVNSMDTLDEFVKTINITLTGKVNELVTKYKDYYVAVLYLNVPSVLDWNERTQLNSCQEQTQRVKQALQERTAFSRWEIEQLAGSEGPCSEPLRKLVASVTDVGSDVKGTLVKMRFSGTDTFFYPTSIVNSYKYPITDQRYFIRTPQNLHVGLESSRLDKTTSFGSKRWYRITSTEEDIKGKIIKASIGVRLDDALRFVNQSIYTNSALITSLVFMLVFLVPSIYYHFMVDERLSIVEAALAVALFLAGGLLLASFGMLLKKKAKFASILFLVWVVLLGLWIAFN